MNGLNPEELKKNYPIAVLDLLSTKPFASENGLNWLCCLAERFLFNGPKGKVFLNFSGLRPLILDEAQWDLSASIFLVFLTYQFSMNIHASISPIKSK